MPLSIHSFIHSFTQPKAIADTIAQTISRNSSSQNYTETFQRVKARKERQPLNFNSNNDEEYNKLFTIEDLKTALKKSHNTAQMRFIIRS